MKFPLSKKPISRLIAALSLAALCLLGALLPVQQLRAVRDYRMDFESYSYNTRKDPVPSPAAYRWSRSFDKSDFGLESLAGLTACHVTDDAIYLAKEDGIVILNHAFQTQAVLDRFENNGEEDSIQNPGDVFVDANKNIYVTEPQRARILLFGPDLKLIRAMGKPDAVGLEEVSYQPNKIAVDSVGRMFVVSRNVYEGIMELSPGGAFTRFYGVNMIESNPMELFWRRFATEEQRANMQLWLPTDFSNVSLNPDGFIFATVQSSSDKDPIKLLNSKGTDILRYPKNLRPVGDFKYLGSNASSFISIDNNEDGVYIVLDATRNRVFAYDEDGYLIYIFGDKGSGEGAFQTPVDARFLGERILVPDQLSQTLELYEPTAYGALINRAIAAGHQGEVEEAESLWREIITLNPQFDFAHIKLADVLYRQGNYEEAEAHYRAGNFPKGYSEAFERTRELWINKNIDILLALLGVIFLLLVWYLIVKPAIVNHRSGESGDEGGIQL